MQFSAFQECSHGTLSNLVCGRSQPIWLVTDAVRNGIAVWNPIFDIIVSRCISGSNLLSGQIITASYRIVSISSIICYGFHPLCFIFRSYLSYSFSPLPSYHNLSYPILSILSFLSYHIHHIHPDQLILSYVSYPIYPILYILSIISYPILSIISYPILSILCYPFCSVHTYWNVSSFIRPLRFHPHHCPEHLYLCTFCPLMCVCCLMS